MATGCLRKAGRSTKPNYSFEKRQRELAKKKKKDEKDAKKRAERDAARPDADPVATGSDTASE